MPVIRDGCKIETRTTISRGGASTIPHAESYRAPDGYDYTSPVTGDIVARLALLR